MMECGYRTKDRLNTSSDIKITFLFLTTTTTLEGAGITTSINVFFSSAATHILLAGG